MPVRITEPLSSPREAPSHEQPHLLVVDDHITEMRFLLELLRHEGYRISVAFDGHQACQRAQAMLPDLIVMDIGMPGLGGLGACRLIRANSVTAHIPIIFLSAAADLEVRLEGFDSGAVDYVIKPYAPEEVLARIRVHLVPRLSPTASGRLEAPVVSGLTRKDADVVEAACCYLRTRLASAPNTEQLAEKFGISEKRLVRAFRRHLGVTVSEFTRKERLAQALRMLRDTSLTMIQIAEELGYSSSANFATSIRMGTGRTPSQWREQQDASGRVVSHAAVPPATFGPVKS